jgi:hypothetical protein
MKFNSHARECLSLSETAFNLVESRLSQLGSMTVRQYIFDHNEWGLGMEILVDILLEKDIAISSEQKQAIQSAMNAMKLDSSQNDIRVLDK